MRILLSNDDGIEAEGIRALVAALAPDHELIVSAPMQQQSGMAHALTVGVPMEVAHDKALEDTYGITAIAVDGTPTDCVKLYLEALSGGKMPDLVISGINHGANLATDILYSGTVGAAMEGYLHDINAIAISLDSWSELSYDEVARIFARDLPDLIEGERHFFFNMNFPKFLKNKKAQYVFGRQGKRDYLNAFHKFERDGKIFYEMAGEIYDSDNGNATDIFAYDNGYISVTPLIVDLTDYQDLDKRLER